MDAPSQVNSGVLRILNVEATRRVMGSGRSDEAQRTTLQIRLGEWRGGRMRGPAVAGRSQRLLPAPPGPRSGGPIAPELPGSSSGCRAGSGWNQRVGWRGSRGALRVRLAGTASTKACALGRNKSQRNERKQPQNEELDLTRSRWQNGRALAGQFWCSTHPWLYGDSIRESERAYSAIWRVDMRKRTGITKGSGAKVGGRVDEERGATWPAGDGCWSGSKMRTCFVVRRAMTDHLPSPAPNGAWPGGLVRCPAGSSAFVACQVKSTAELPCNRNQTKATDRVNGYGSRA